ncbi:hypothetical protein HK101_012001 [Irineochytrium annulatum]|nr:hypothetical protein HK101_012001 [Irineochytrium annulatum]
MSAFVSATKYYLPFASNLDLVKSKLNIDLPTMLDGIAADSSITSEFQMHSRIYAAVNSIPPTFGYSYDATCFESWQFLQPWLIDVVVDSTGPLFYLGRTYSDVRIEANVRVSAYKAVKSAFTAALNGDPGTYKGYQITSINGQEPAVLLNALGSRNGAPDPLNEAGAFFGVAADGTTTYSGGFLTTNVFVYDDFYQKDVTYSLKGPSGDTRSLTVPWQAIYRRRQTDFTNFFYDWCVAIDVDAPLRRRDVEPEPAPARQKRVNPSFVNVTRRDANPLRPVYFDAQGNGFFMVTSAVGVWTPSVYVYNYRTPNAWPNLFASIDKGLKALSTAGAKTLIIDLTTSGWSECAGFVISKYLFGTAEAFQYDVALPFPQYLHGDPKSFGELMRGVVDLANITNFGTAGYTPVTGASSISSATTTIRGVPRSSRFTVTCDFNLGTLPSSPFPASSVFLLSDGLCIGSCAQFVYSAQQNKVPSYVFGMAPNGGLASYAPAFFTPLTATSGSSLQSDMTSIDGTDDKPFVTYPADLYFPFESAYLPGTAVGDDAMPVEFVQSPFADATYLPIKNVTDVLGIWTGLAGQIAGTPATFADGMSTPAAGAGNTLAGSGSGSSSKPSLAVIIGAGAFILLFSFDLEATPKITLRHSSSTACGGAVLIVIAVVVGILLVRRSRATKAAASSPSTNSDSTPASGLHTVGYDARVAKPLYGDPVPPQAAQSFGQPQSAHAANAYGQPQSVYSQQQPTIPQAIYSQQQPTQPQGIYSQQQQPQAVYAPQQHVQHQPLYGQPQPLYATGDVGTATARQPSVYGHPQSVYGGSVEPPATQMTANGAEAQQQQQQHPQQ